MISGFRKGMLKTSSAIKRFHNTFTFQYNAMMKKEWFEDWFDTPQYHLLYKKHDEKEAQRALDHLLSALHLQGGERILDMACGKGRHSRYLAEKGFEVTGLDLSPKSIAYARKSEHAHLHFYQHDMRRLFRTNYFDAVMNMFTSFGYFANDLEHLRTMRNMAKGLKPGGMLLIDFFNAVWLRQYLVAEEVKTIDEVVFHLQKQMDDKYVYKSVEFEVNGVAQQFRERVRLFELADFERLFEQSGLHLLDTYGGYDLGAFDPEQSQRLILIAQKKD